MKSQFPGGSMNQQRTHQSSQPPSRYYFSQGEATNATLVILMFSCKDVLETMVSYKPFIPACGRKD